MTGPIEREDWVKAVADAIEPKFRGLGHGDAPRQIAYEVAQTAIDAIQPLIDAEKANSAEWRNVALYGWDD